MKVTVQHRGTHIQTIIRHSYKLTTEDGRVAEIYDEPNSPQMKDGPYNMTEEEFVRICEKGKGYIESEVDDEW